MDAAAQTLEFSSWGTTLGLWALLVGGLVTGLAGLGTAVLAITGKAGGRPTFAGATLMLWGLCGVCAWFATAHLKRFDTLTIEPDGAWIARNTLGVTVLELGPDDLRAVDFLQNRLTGKILLVKTQVAIELPDGRIFESVEAPADAQQSATEALQAIIAPHRTE